MIILIGALQNVPSEIIEAAKVDGANKLDVLWFITLPTIMPTILLMVVTLTSATFQLFAPVYAMTGGNPGGVTRISVYYIYLQAFRYSQAGYASALSIILLGILLIVSVAQFMIIRSGNR